jgi:hypothetical protein
MGVGLPLQKGGDGLTHKIMIVGQQYTHQLGTLMWLGGLGTPGKRLRMYHGFVHNRLTLAHLLPTRHHDACNRPCRRRGGISAISIETPDYTNG